MLKSISFIVLTQFIQFIELKFFIVLTQFIQFIELKFLRQAYFIF